MPAEQENPSVFIRSNHRLLQQIYHDDQRQVAYLVQAIDLLERITNMVEGVPQALDYLVHEHSLGSTMLERPFPEKPGAFREAVKRQLGGRLTPAHYVIIPYVVRGLSDKEIAELLPQELDVDDVASYKSPRTIAAQKQEICNRLGLVHVSEIPYAIFRVLW